MARGYEVALALQDLIEDDLSMETGQHTSWQDPLVKKLGELAEAYPDHRLVMEEDEAGPCIKLIPLDGRRTAALHRAAVDVKRPGPSAIEACDSLLARSTA